MIGDDFGRAVGKDVARRIEEGNLAEQFWPFWRQIAHELLAEVDMEERASDPEKAHTVSRMIGRRHGILMVNDRLSLKIRERNRIMEESKIRSQERANGERSGPRIE